jgi:hypothetical protein
VYYHSAVRAVAIIPVVAAKQNTMNMVGREI